MEKIILPEYKINERTGAIFTEYGWGYSSKVLEDGKFVYVNMKALDIVKQACIDAWSSYDGRRDAVVKKLNYVQKVPIPIDPARKLLFFPTHSPKHDHNCWISARHISIADYGAAQGRTLVNFHNKMFFTLPVSPYVLNKQITRSLICAHLISMTASNT